jgi:hypothetical protein
MRRAKLGAKQKKLLELLRENAGKTVTEDEILKATNRKPRSFRVDLGNGHFDPYLHEISAKRFRVTAARDLDERAFLRQVSQTAAHRELGACFEQHSRES